ncbi:MAG: glycosyltransferase [Candidatus Tenebribacter burtonii]|nr:glycosyltransferase [Candidatus Tenebribacter burtonii]
MEFTIYIFAILYFMIIFSFFIGILFLNNSKNAKINKISVIIAARNEEKHIYNLLNSLISQNFPKENYEIIIVDDRSEDNTSNIVNKYKSKNSNIMLLQVKNESKVLLGKKGALDKGIRAAKHNILAFTDSDCVPTNNWLLQINNHFTDDTDIVAGYSYIYYKNPFFKFLKNLERSSIFAVIAGSFGWNWGVTITAGNMAYRKELYDKVNGFNDIGLIKSGDDVLMIQKMGKIARRMKFMFHPDSIVNTGRDETTGSQIQQETRRGSKWYNYTIPVKMMTLFIFVYYLVFVGCFMGFTFAYISTTLFVIILFLKIIPEFLLLTLFLVKMKRLKLMWIFPIAELIYIPYFIIFGLKGTFGKYKWKE